MSSNDVPDIVQNCIQQIEDRGQHANGIYRVCGAKSKIDTFIKDYENNPKTIVWEELSPIVIANVLKCYLREVRMLFCPSEYFLTNFLSASRAIVDL